MSIYAEIRYLDPSAIIIEGPFSIMPKDAPPGYVPREFYTKGGVVNTGRIEVVPVTIDPDGGARIRMDKDAFAVRLFKATALELNKPITTRTYDEVEFRAHDGISGGGIERHRIFIRNPNGVEFIPLDYEVTPGKINKTGQKVVYILRTNGSDKEASWEMKIRPEHVQRALLGQPRLPTLDAA